MRGIQVYSQRGQGWKPKIQMGFMFGKENDLIELEIDFTSFPIGQYVIFHELVHLEHMNHSQQFWNHLQSLLPDTKNLDKELSEVSEEVIRLGQVSYGLNKLQSSGKGVPMTRPPNERK